MEVIVRNTKLKDATGERIDFPKNGKPYFDTAFRKTFNTPAEKYHYMKSINAVSNGDSDAKYKREQKEHYEQKMDTRERRK